MVEKGFYDLKSGKLRDLIFGVQLIIIDVVEKGYVNFFKREIKDLESKEFVIIVEVVGKFLFDLEIGLFNDKFLMGKFKFDEVFERQIFSRFLILFKMVRDGIFSDRGYVINLRIGEVMFFFDVLDFGLIDDIVKCVVNFRINDVFLLFEVIEQGFLDFRGLFVLLGVLLVIFISEVLV